MRIFVIYFSTLTFLFIELFGLLRGDPVGGILLKSVGAFAVFFLLGNTLCNLLDSMKKAAPSLRQAAGISLKEAATSSPPSSEAKGAPVTPTEVLKEEALRIAREKPKEVAKVFENMISK